VKPEENAKREKNVKTSLYAPYKRHRKDSGLTSVRVRINESGLLVRSVRIPGSRPGIMWTCIVRVTGIMSTMIPGEGIQHACGQFEHAIDSVNLARVKRKEKKRGETWFPFNFV
jgi:hypothetical protein